ncbi:lipopolysaccharide transport periplasmic protein LptA [Maricurvus nonylphenolicus]|uniref:lipopolysaccharide transport periplasmic protein LptA n=1 Tax=Maricurvus nonylphenolicus TaxID=1008307 RepID=UPI0036F26502
MSQFKPQSTRRTGVLASCFATAILLLTSSLCFGLASDRDQPIYIESDSAERNEKDGITIYRGKVKMDQGTLRILADKVTIHSIDNQVTKIIAVGKPAHYQQKPSPEKETVIAKGNTIEYFIDQEKLHLINDASLKQEGSTMTGKRINYDIKASQVKASGGSRTSKQRIQMVIPPKPKGNAAN